MAEKKEPEMLVEKTQYLTAGVHIGMKSCTPYMKSFVYKIRDDGLAVFNLQKVDERIKTGAKFLSKFNNVMIVSRKDSAAKSITAFAEATDSKVVSGRFSPGTLTNPSYKDFYEPDAVFVIDPLIDEQVIKEAKKKRVPIIAFCDTFNSAKDVDYVIPVNNNGKKALVLVLWILAREIQKNRGKKFSMTVKDFGDEESSDVKTTESRHRYNKQI
ncbi:MAG: 30S ribosomal protein S2 [Nanoarchaeota archaeon]|nr:30S ribosomal protein S2 [Nanoarchaeota archaeon]MBU1135087.1 30S ribosomal protein S2 [Nanoarchaeota archaeon]MBU2519990.1 30S ribosomal protein S2 [Nanoarchaeota archaeon]